MEQQIGDWGLFPWCEEHGENLIYPDDLDKVRGLDIRGKVLRYDAEEGQYISLCYGDICVRVSPDLFQPVPPLMFQIGQRVSFMKGGKLVVGEVADIYWHYKRALPIYRLKLDGHRLSKRYWDDDLALVDE